MTDAEKRLWSRLRRRQLDGHRFRRQVPIGSYIADFGCLNSRLVIELDGGQHNEAGNEALDAERTERLKTQGFRVLRFWNSDVLMETDSVMETIFNALSFTPDTDLTSIQSSS
jgi:very-short-patch-repair endonuclease